MDAQLRARAEAWFAEDPDPDTRAELRPLIDAGDDEALAARFAGRLEFGTAGLRGEIGAGPMRMNRVIVRREPKACKRDTLKETAADPAAIVTTTSTKAAEEEPTISAEQEQAIGLLGAGKSVAEAAEVMGVSRGTVHRWLREDAEFVAAYNAWRREVGRAARMRP